MAVAASYTRVVWKVGWDDRGILKQGRLDGVDTTMMTAMATATTATATATARKWWRSDLIIKLRRGWSPAPKRVCTKPRPPPSKPASGP
jgi:hypothetical protein